MAFLIASVGCSKGGSGEVKGLAESYCRNFFREVNEATEKYNQLATAVAANKLDPDQRKRAESELPYGSTREQRALVSLELNKRMSFCATIRAGGFEKLDARFAGIFQDFREKDDPADNARAMSQMATFAQDLGKLPLKQ